jgi:hypothetical protein
MLFALAVTGVDFVAFLLSKIHEGQVIALAAFMFFFKPRSIPLKAGINVLKKRMSAVAFASHSQKRSL